MSEQPGVPRTYLQGVPCWVDTEQEDVEAAQSFYGSLFGWTFEDAMPPDAPGTYLIASLNGQDVAAIGPGDGQAAWNTYIAVDDADASAAAVTAAGGAITADPEDAGPGGRSAGCTDPEGIAFRLWQPRRRLGAQLVNAPGAWNFSNLRTDDRDAALAFYTTVFGWVMHDFDQDADAMIAVPGLGDHLAASSDPSIYERQAGAPPGFADVIAGFEPTDEDERAHWHVIFSVADRDASVASADRLGATVLSTADTKWARVAALRDPQGAEFSVSQFTPPDDY